MQRPDIFAAIEGQAKGTEKKVKKSNDADTLFAVYTWRYVTATQSAYNRTNQDLYATLYLVTDKAATILVAIHVYDERETRGNGLKSMQELESKYLRVTNVTIRALHAALPATCMEPDEDPDYQVMKATRVGSWLAAVKEPVTDRHFTGIIVQGLP